VGKEVQINFDYFEVLFHVDKTSLRHAAIMQLSISKISSIDPLSFIFIHLSLSTFPSLKR
jgi:hypothetical protein